MLPTLPDVDEVILVDGRSVDDTVAVARRLRPEIEIITQSRRGKGNALAQGFEVATGDVIIVFDVSRPAAEDEIEALVTALVAGADFAKSSRFTAGRGRNITQIRYLGNKVLSFTANVAFGLRYSDLGDGNIAFWRDIVPVLDLPASRLRNPSKDAAIWGDGFEIEVLIKCRVAAAGLVVDELPAVERTSVDRNLIALSDGTRALRTIRREWRRARRGERTQQPSTVFSHTPAQLREIA